MPNLMSFDVLKEDQDQMNHRGPYHHHQRHKTGFDKRGTIWRRTIYQPNPAPLIRFQYAIDDYFYFFRAKSNKKMEQQAFKELEQSGAGNAGEQERIFNVSANPDRKHQPLETFPYPSGARSHGCDARNYYRRRSPVENDARFQCIRYSDGF